MSPVLGTRTNAQRLVATLAVALLLGLPVAAGAQADTGDADPDETLDPEDVDGEDGPDEETSLSGYRTRAEAAPFAILLFEPLLPFPVDPGMPHMEVQAAYTRSTLNTGPTGRALASTLWPGSVLGDGLENLAEDTDYPIKSDAQYPGGPESDEVEIAPGVGMRTSAEELGTDAYAHTTDLPSDVLEIGAFESHSTASVEDDQAIARARASIQDIALLGGLIQIDGLVTDIAAQGDGATAATSGQTTVTGLEIAGFGFSVDADGLHAEGAEDVPELPFGLANRTPDELRELLGIEIELLGHEEEIDGTNATRSAQGLRIVLDTTVLREAVVDPLLQPLVEVLPDELRNPSLPDEVPINPVDLLFLESEVHVVLGRAVVTSNTVEPMDFDFDFGDDVGDTADLDVGSQQEASSPDLGGSDTGGSSPEPSSAPSPSVADGDADDTVAEPEVSEQPPGEESVQAMEAANLEASPGVGLVASLVAFGLAGLGARGLHGMGGRVFAAGGGCDTGPTSRVPDLKER